jgi:hypothetical protein
MWDNATHFSPATSTKHTARPPAEAGAGPTGTMPVTCNAATLKAGTSHAHLLLLKVQPGITAVGAAPAGIPCSAHRLRCAPLGLHACCSCYRLHLEAALQHGVHVASHLRPHKQSEQVASANRRQQAKQPQHAQSGMLGALPVFVCCVSAGVVDPT